MNKRWEWLHFFHLTELNFTYIWLYVCMHVHTPRELFYDPNVFLGDLLLINSWICISEIRHSSPVKVTLSNLLYVFSQVLSHYLGTIQSRKALLSFQSRWVRRRTFYSWDPLFSCLIYFKDNHWGGKLYESNWQLILNYKFTQDSQISGLITVSTARTTLGRVPSTWCCVAGEA